MTENLPEATADALHRAVRDLGRRVGENPDRVRAVLSDALGAAAREHRSEIDALALASEEGIPATLVGREESLLTESDLALDDNRLRGRLVERGLSAGAADYAIGAWAAALGSISSLSITGGLTSAVAGAGTGSVSDPATELPDEPRAVDEAGAAGSILGFSVADETPPRHRQVVPLGRRVVAGAAAGVLAIVAGAGWFSTAGDGPTRSTLTDSALGSVASTTTTVSTGAVSTTAPTAPTTKSPAKTKAPTKAPSTSKPSPARSSSSTSPRKSSSSTSPRKSSSSSSPRRSSSSTSPRSSSSSTAPKTLVAKNTSAAWTPKYYETGVNQCVDFVPPHAAGNICEAALNVVKSGTVTTWSISGASSVNGHGSVRISGRQIMYAPHHNGAFTDTVRYRLSGSGVTSNWATISVTVYCNQDMGCWG